MQARLNLPPVQHGEPGAHVTDRDGHVDHAVTDFQRGLAAAHRQQFPFRKLDSAPGSSSREFISSGRWPTSPDRSAVRAARFSDPSWSIRRPDRGEGRHRQRQGGPGSRHGCDRRPVRHAPQPNVRSTRRPGGVPSPRSALGYPQLTSTGRHACHGTATHFGPDGCRHPSCPVSLDLSHRQADLRCSGSAARLCALQALVCR
jgi:hypothetical protein